MIRQRRQEAEVREQAMQQAPKILLNGVYRSVNRGANPHGITETLRICWKGGMSQIERDAEQQLLIKSEKGICSVDYAVDTSWILSSL